MGDDFFDIGWEEMALAGSLAEEMAEAEKEKRKPEAEIEQEDCECGCEDPPDEDPCS
jgi:hypothetical protein